MRNAKKSCYQENFDAYAPDSPQENSDDAASALKMISKQFFHHRYHQYCTY
jgi:hypothetical protein